jgi:hypothetical protein
MPAPSQRGGSRRNAGGYGAGVVTSVRFVQNRVLDMSEDFGTLSRARFWRCERRGPTDPAIKRYFRFSTFRHFGLYVCFVVCLLERMWNGNVGC